MLYSLDAKVTAIEESGLETVTRLADVTIHKGLRGSVEGEISNLVSIQ
jgi:hypothetical protein